ncbi:MAG: alpha/beta fold hydrolase [Chitinivibrionales bacterium]|nr:alpha/beta fold hydrolase [Chitinivibrionales bacterium]
MLNGDKAGMGICAGCLTCLTVLTATMTARSCPCDSASLFTSATGGRIREHAPLFGSNDILKRSGELCAYYCKYRLVYPECRHSSGYVASGKHRIFANVWIPDSAQATVVLVHGYLDHTAFYKPVIDVCLENNLAVAAFDLPGHGLSTGQPASIESFAEYADAVDDFLQRIDSVAIGSLIAVGHSTGCAALFEFLHGRRRKLFDRIIFIAPLVRSRYWSLSHIGNKVLSPFCKTTMRLFRRTSSDENFLKFKRHDPLQAKQFPVRWGQACFAWNEKIQSYSRISARVTIFQGAKDDVVDWKYNIPFLKSKIKVVDVTMIEDAKHHIHNEASMLREPFLDALLEAMLEAN